METVSSLTSSTSAYKIADGNIASAWQSADCSRPLSIAAKNVVENACGKSKCSASCLMLEPSLERSTDASGYTAARTTFHTGYRTAWYRIEIDDQTLWRLYVRGIFAEGAILSLENTTGEMTILGNVSILCPTFRLVSHVCIIS